MKLVTSIFVVAVSLTAMIPVEQAEGSLIPYDFARKLLRTEENHAQETTKNRASLEETANSNKGKKHHLAFLLLDDSQHHSGDHERKDKAAHGKGSHKEYGLEGDAIPSKPVIVPQKYGGHSRHAQHRMKNHHNDAQRQSGSRALQDFEETVNEGFPRNQKGQKMLIGVPDEHGIVFPGVNGGHHRGRPSRLAIRDHGPHSIVRKIPVHNEEDDDFRLPTLPPVSEGNDENFHLTVYKADQNGKVKKVYDSAEATPQQQKERKEELGAWMNEMRRQQEAMDTIFKELLTAPRLRGQGFQFPSIDLDELEKHIEGTSDRVGGDNAGEGQVEDGNEGSDSIDNNSDEGKDRKEDQRNSKSSSDGADDSNVSNKGVDDSSAPTKGKDSSDSRGLIVGIAGAALTVVAVAALVVVKLRKQRQVQQVIDVPADDHYIDLERTSPQRPAGVAQQDRYVRLQE